MLTKIERFTYLKLLHFFFKENAHVNFLFSMVLLVVLLPYFEENSTEGFGAAIISSYNILATLYYIIHDKRNYWLTALAFLAIIFEWMNFLGLHDERFLPIHRYLESFPSVGVAVLFSWALIKLFRTIFYAVKVDVNVIVSSISGYLAMGLIGAFVFQLLDRTVPGSFHVPSADTMDLHDTVYYSFVTMSTLGYGDMVPVGGLARGMAILLTLCGQMYMTMVIAMLIGKFIAADQGRSRSQKDD